MAATLSSALPTTCVLLWLHFSLSKRLCVLGMNAGRPFFLIVSAGARRGPAECQRGCVTPAACMTWGITVVSLFACALDASVSHLARSSHVSHKPFWGLFLLDPAATWVAHPVKRAGTHSCSHSPRAGHAGRTRGRAEVSGCLSLRVSLLWPAPMSHSQLAQSCTLATRVKSTTQVPCSLGQPTPVNVPLSALAGLAARLLLLGDDSIRAARILPARAAVLAISLVRG
jgi:hypothetical protein